MKLRDLLKGVQAEIRGGKEANITGVSVDSRKVAPGHLFLAKKGERVDGAQFIPQALEAGAAAIVTDLYDPFLKVPQVIVPNPASLEAILAARFYGHPSEKLFVVGVTGTKGKTTTSYLSRHLLESLRGPAGLITTVETWMGPASRAPSQFTTHDAVTNQRALKEMLLKGCASAVLECSSHGLSQGRVDEIRFQRALFTNLAPDHLDYHKSLQEYAKAKRILFEKLEGVALLNGDDPWAPFFAEATDASLTFGLSEKVDVRGHPLSFDPKGGRFEVTFQGQKELFTTPLLGRFNLYNLLGAISLALSLGAPLASLVDPIATFEGVPGRLQKIAHPSGVTLFIDYAHTGPSLRFVLETLRELGPKRLFTLFGAGGSRDPQRRPQMGEAAAHLADHTFITTDNPRTEDPKKISEEIFASFHSAPHKAEILLDRREAIFEAVKRLQPGDFLLIAGKGHEEGQIFAHETLPFNDLEVAKSALLCHFGEP